MTHKLILIVDDDYVYKLVMRKMIHLCYGSAEIIGAANGLEAMTCFSQPCRMFSSGCQTSFCWILKCRK